jgi:hypothetical protein
MISKVNILATIWLSFDHSVETPSFEQKTAEAPGRYRRFDPEDVGVSIAGTVCPFSTLEM